MIKRLLALLKTKKQEPKKQTTFEVELVLKDNSGICWYKYRDALKMPVARYLEIQSAAQMADLAITRSDLNYFIFAIEKELNGSHKSIEELRSKVNPLFYELKARTSLLAERKTLLNLAACYVLRDDEDSNSFNPKIHKEKVDYWNKDAELAGFFLQLALNFTTNLNKELQQGIVDYLAQSERIMREHAFLFKHSSTT